MDLSDQFVDPCSGGQFRLSNVPGTILSMLTPEHSTDILPAGALKNLFKDYDKVVLFLVDGFGWKTFNSLACRRSFIKSRVEKGVLLKLITQFPSTTACNVTTINTGEKVAEHGLFEWFYYEPLADDIIAPLLYSYAREQKTRDTLKRDTSVWPVDIYPSNNIYKTLDSYGIKSYAFQNKDYARSTFSDIIFGPAIVKGYGTTDEGMAALSRAVIDEPGKAYYYFYFDGIDSALHHYGPGSVQVKDTFKQFLKSVERTFWKNIRITRRDKVHNTAFILTADHGQTSIDPARTIYLNLAFPEIEGYLRRNCQGRILAPAGSCRDMFLYVRDECLEDAFALLQEKLNGRAVVCRTDDLIKHGYFGKCEISETLRRRLGDIIILPLDGESVWWYEKGVFEVDFKGHHGGLTKDEMEIPFLMWAL